MISQSKQNFESSFTREEGTIIKMSKFMQQSSQQLSPINRFDQKNTRAFGVNTSRVMVFDNSVQLIVPVTHFVFSDVRPTNKLGNKLKINEDGLDEQNSAPYRSTIRDPISNKSEHKEQKSHYTYNKIYKSKPHKEWQFKPANYNPEKVQTKKLNAKVNKIKQIIDTNIKQMQMSQNIIRQSRKTKKSTQNNEVAQQEKPVVKKNFKISSLNNRLSESKIIKKQEIINEARNMVFNKNQMRTSRIGKIEKNKPQILQENREQNFNKKQTISNIQSEENPNLLVIDLRTPVSKIKRCLIQSQGKLMVRLNLPGSLFFTPNLNTSNQELKQKMISIFYQIEQQIQIISIKKYQDRVQLRNKSLFIIWYYNGDGYFGGWTGGDQIIAESNKNGLGVQWVAAGPHGGSTYYGEFKDNKKQGYGILKNHNYQIYIGCWKNNHKWGWGKIYDQDGKLKYNGQFVENQIVNEQLLN